MNLERTGKLGRGGLAFAILVVALVTITAPHDLAHRVAPALFWLMGAMAVIDAVRLRHLLRLTPREVFAGQLASTQHGRPPLFSPLETVAFWIGAGASAFAFFT